MTIPHAPYNFVPLATWVYESDWAPFVTHDVPFVDGMSGELKIEITAHTPILVGGERSEEQASWTDAAGKTSHGKINVVKPFKLGDRYAIPPSTLQGAIRSIIEIATFSRFHRVDDTRFGIRDLTDTIYRNRLVNKVRAGFLSFDTAASQWKVAPCNFERIGFDALLEFANNKRFEWEAQRDRKARDVEARYDALGWSNIQQDLVIDSGWARKPTTGEKTVPGTIVLTGNTGIRDERRKKKGEFVFHGQDIKLAISIDPRVIREFTSIHDPDDGRPKNPAWQMWSERLRTGRTSQIPVFWLAGTDPSGQARVVSLGLAMMFKLAHSGSTHDLIRNSAASHLENRRLDFASALFGDTADTDEDWVLKGRVAFDFAQGPRVTDGTTERTITVTMGPKPSYFPSYVEQPRDSKKPNFLLPNGNRLGTYASYTPLEGKDVPNGYPTEQKELLIAPRLRGHKRYPVRPLSMLHFNPLPDNAKAKQLTGLRYLRPAANGRLVFETTLRFHNLRPQELGALVWALTWGGDPALRHAFGAGKAFGLGQVSLAITGGRAQPNRPDQRPIEVNDDWQRIWREAFCSDMERAFSHGGGKSKWCESAQIRELNAMANLAYATGKDLTHMPLQDFIDAKGQAGVLRPYSENTA